MKYIGFILLIQSVPYFSGECACKDSFLTFKNSSDSTISCYQENLQGPCEEKFQYVQSKDKNSDETAHCVPTNCETGEVRISDTCIPAKACKKHEIVEFDVENSKAVCKSALFIVRAIISGATKCENGETENLAGECQEASFLGGSEVKRSLSLGGALSLRSYVRRRSARFG